MTDTKPLRWLVTPLGTIAERVLTEGLQTASIDEVDEWGGISDYSSGDFPDMGIVGDNVAHVSDWDAAEFLDTHCRVLEADHADIDTMTDRFPAWPEEIVQACSRAEHASYALLRLERFRQALPQDYLDSTTVTVLDAVVGKRLEEELAALNLKIDTWRAANPEVQTVRLSDRLENTNA